jgi:chemotaxis protein CheX
MKSEYIHPFVEAAIKVLEDSTGTVVRRGLVSLRASPVPTMGIASVIGILGDAEGRLLLDLSRETACRLASRMNDIRIDAFDELVTSTINEVVNMIGGRAVSDLVNKGHRLDITPPTLFSGTELEVSNTQLENIIIPLETEYGPVTINIAFRYKS